MRASTAVLAAFTLVVGVGGGAVAYELASGVGEPAGATSAATEVTAVVEETPATIVPGTRFRWAPCQAPAVLRGDTCVTSVVRTVVLPPPTVAVGTTAGAVATTAYQDDDEDEGYDDDDEGYDDHEDDDHDEDEDDDHDEDEDDDHDEDEDD